MLVVEEHYVSGIPQTAVAGFAPHGAAWHWSAGGSGREGWESTIRHLVNTRYTVNASYHGGFWCEHRAGHADCRTVIQWIVPTTRAAHSLNPANAWKLNPDKPQLVQEARFLEVHRILGRDSDPNADCLALAYAGMPADLERDLRCGVFRADVQNIARQLVAHPAIVDEPHFGHGWIQPLTRYEMDVATNFIGLLYGELTAPQEDDMALVGFEPIINRRAVIAKGAAARSQPAFERNDYDAFLIATEPNQRTRTAVAWVQGTPLIANDGTVINASTRWLLTDSDSHGAIFYHEQDVVTFEAIETVTVEVPIGITPEQLDQAKRLEFGRGRDEATAAYTAAGEAAARAVMP